MIDLVKRFGEIQVDAVNLIAFDRFLENKKVRDHKAALQKTMLLCRNVTAAMEGYVVHHDALNKPWITDWIGRCDVFPVTSIEDGNNNTFLLVDGQIPAEQKAIIKDFNYLHQQSSLKFKFLLSFLLHIEQ